MEVDRQKYIARARARSGTVELDLLARNLRNFAALFNKTYPGNTEPLMEEGSAYPVFDKYGFVARLGDVIIHACRHRLFDNPYFAQLACRIPLGILDTGATREESCKALHALMWWLRRQGHKIEGSAAKQIRQLATGLSREGRNAKKATKRIGQCPRCGKSPRSLKETLAHGFVCHVCYREIHPRRATPNAIYNLRRVGFTVPEDLTEKEGKRLWLLYLGRKLGLSLPDDIPLAELLRMDTENSFIQRLQPVFAAEHERQVTEEIERRSEYLPPVRHFYTKVVGVVHKNDDGSDRQEILSTCSPLETLRLEHEDNPYDPNAIRVCTEDGRQIGHLPREVASDVWWRMQHRFTYAAISANITGGTRGQPTIGMNILLLVGQPGVTLEEMQTYLDSITPDVSADARARSSLEGDD